MKKSLLALALIGLVSAGSAQAAKVYDKEMAMISPLRSTPRAA